MQEMFAVGGDCDNAGTLIGFGAMGVGGAARILGGRDKSFNCANVGFLAGSVFFKLNDDAFLKCVKGVRIVKSVFDRNVPTFTCRIDAALAANHFEQTRFAGALLTLYHDAILIIAPGVENAGEKGSKPIKRYDAGEAIIVGIEEFYKESFGAGYSVPRGQIGIKIADFIIGARLGVDANKIINQLFVSEFKVS